MKDAPRVMQSQSNNDSLTGFGSWPPSLEGEKFPPAPRAGHGRHGTEESQPFDPKEHAVPRAEIGRTGRVWMLPCYVSKNTDRLTGAVRAWMSPEERHTMRGACHFLKRHDSSVYNRLIDALLEIEHARHTPAPGSLQTSPRFRDIIEARECCFSEKPLVAATRRPPIPIPATEPAPRNLPSWNLPSSHWAAQRHSTSIHSGKATYSEEYQKEILAFEERTDRGCIEQYLNKYSALSANYSGAKLDEATRSPKFSDVYETCMALCLGEAGMPGHFLSLIHYGIGLQHLLTTCHTAWSAPLRGNAWGVTPSILKAERAAVPHRDRAFDRLVEMYVEDFG